jgi:DNA polymerase-4
LRIAASYSQKNHIRLSASPAGRRTLKLDYRLGLHSALTPGRFSLVTELKNESMYGSRKIIHIDMDSFYAAVERKYRPELRGKPIAVGGPPESRGVIATASYEARAFGVRSAMSSARAFKLCPELILIAPDFAKYKKESRAVRAILERFADKIEPLSLDEAYLDVTGSAHFGGSATLIAEEIRRVIREELGLTASAGVAPNKFLAKIASDVNKPDGIKVIRPGEIESFVKTLPIEKIWGVGKVTAKKMHSRGIHACADLARFSVTELTQMYGSWGVALYDFARGIDRRPVETDWERKSLSVEETYPQDIASLDEILACVDSLYEDWNERMVRSGESDRIRTIFVKLKYHDFKSSTHEEQADGFPQPIEFKRLLTELYAKRGEPVRLIGLGVRFESSGEKEHKTPQLKLPIDPAD